MLLTDMVWERSPGVPEVNTVSYTTPHNGTLQDILYTTQGEPYLASSVLKSFERLQGIGCVLRVTISNFAHGAMPDRKTEATSWPTRSLSSVDDSILRRPQAKRYKAEPVMEQSLSITRPPPVSCSTRTSSAFPRPLLAFWPLSSPLQLLAQALPR